MAQEDRDEVWVTENCTLSVGICRHVKFREVAPLVIELRKTPQTLKAGVAMIHLSQIPFP